VHVGQPRVFARNTFATATVHTLLVPVPHPVRAQHQCARQEHARPTHAHMGRRAVVAVGPRVAVIALAGPKCSQAQTVAPAGLQPGARTAQPISAARSPKQQRAQATCSQASNLLQEACRSRCWAVTVEYSPRFTPLVPSPLTPLPPPLSRNVTYIWHARKTVQNRMTSYSTNTNTK
jgi:hypothetical protein